MLMYSIQSSKHLLRITTGSGVHKDKKDLIFIFMELIIVEIILLMLSHGINAFVWFCFPNQIGCRLLENKVFA